MTIRSFFWGTGFFLLFAYSATSANPGIVFRSEIDSAAIQDKQAGYRETLERLEKRRLELATAYRYGQTDVISEARTTILTMLLCDLFPAWYGTEWDFNGVTQTPGEGQIACGYFVTTCLRDAGFDLSRVKLAQQPSQRIIKSLADPNAIKLLSDEPMSEIESYLREAGPGLYIVGLDRHTGFVVNDGENLAFVHSSYYKPPFSVTAEPIDSKNPLADSRYRMFGKLLSDGMIRKWILGQRFEMK